MNLWSLIDKILDWIWHWRFNVCFLGGIALAGVFLFGIPYAPVAWSLAGLAFIAGIGIGMYWDMSHD